MQNLDQLDAIKAILRELGLAEKAVRWEQRAQMSRPA